MDTVRETALLGTGKRTLDVQQLPEHIRKALLHGTADQELQFLQANALNVFFNLAGQTPEKLVKVVDQDVIIEDRQVTGKEVMDIYPKFELVDHQIREKALEMWLDVMMTRNQIVSPDRVVDLLHFGKQASNHTKAKILKVVGRKGQWIVQNDTTLGYTKSVVSDNVWHEGTLHERKTTFIALRQSHPVEAMKLLESTWATESIVNKKAFLDIIYETAQVADVPFLENTCLSEFAYQPKEKKTEKECRRITVRILLRFPQSAIYQLATTNLSKYLVKGKKGIVGFVTGQSGNTFRLPDAEDEFWNKRVMEETFGFEVNRYDIALYQTILQLWLSEFLEALPFNFWLDAFEADHKKSVQFWLLDKTIIAGESISIYQQALANNAEFHHDGQLALALVSTLKNTTNRSLLKLLKPADFESLLIRDYTVEDWEALGSGPFSANQPWSREFSEEILKRAYKLAEQNKSSTALGKVIAQFAHPDAINTLYSINNTARESGTYHLWNTTIFQIVSPMLEIKSLIYALQK